MTSTPLIHRIYDVILPPFRRRRMRRVDDDVMEQVDVARIVDLGGDPEIWGYSRFSPHVTLVNVLDMPPVDNPRIVAVQADATATAFADDSFDLVFSNSVIEHVGEDRWDAFAQECHRLAPSMFVQTPARWFPFEPHLLTPFVHYLPRSVQSRVLRYATVWGWLMRPTKAQVDTFLRDTTLLRRRDMERLFPDCELHVERFLGLPKSYVAVRTPRAGD